MQLILPDWSGKLILVAEDTEMNYKYLEAILNKSKARIIWAKDGLDAVAKATEFVPDIGLIDINMPKMNGYEVCRLIKKEHPNIPLIAQTAYAHMEDKERCEDAGFNNFIAKPFDFEELVLVMKEYI